MVKMKEVMNNHDNPEIFGAIRAIVERWPQPKDPIVGRSLNNIKSTLKVCIEKLHTRTKCKTSNYCSLFKRSYQTSKKQDHKDENDSTSISFKRSTFLCFFKLVVIPIYSIENGYPIKSSIAPYTSISMFQEV